MNESQRNLRKQTQISLMVALAAIVLVWWTGAEEPAPRGALATYTFLAGSLLTAALLVRRTMLQTRQGYSFLRFFNEDGELDEDHCARQYQRAVRYSLALVACVIPLGTALGLLYTPRRHAWVFLGLAIMGLIHFRPREAEQRGWRARLLRVRGRYAD